MLEEKKRYEGTLHRRFVIRVLAPPFLALLVMGAATLWQLSSVMHKRAIDDLRRSAVTAASTLEREFALRETVLSQTGSELFIIKTEYNAGRKKLDANRDSCRQHILQAGTFEDAPKRACEPFLSGFAIGGTSLIALEKTYLKLGEDLISEQNQRIKDRLSAFKQFFPEVLALLVVDERKNSVSSALSGVFKNSSQLFREDAVRALNEPIRGKLTAIDGYDLAIFAIPIPGGSALAAYDIENANFVRRVWSSAPINKTTSLAVVLDSNGQPVYPMIKDGDNFVRNNAKLVGEDFVELKLDQVDHTVVAAGAGTSNWMVAVASPTAAVSTPVRDTQLAGIIVLGIFVVGFFWVGTIFIQRTLRNIVTLVSGAIIFGAGKLDYKIALDHADEEFTRLADTMNTMAGRIAAAEREIDEKNKEFISVATHELRAPLTVVIGYLSVFKERHDKKMDQKSQTLIDQAFYSTVRLKDLVNDMLNIARLESGRYEVSLETLSIKNVAEDVINAMSVVADIAQVELRYLPERASMVMADTQKLRIVINNFVSNAIKYNRPGSYVTIWHYRQGDQLVTVVEDNGLGIPEEQKAHMFEKFFRVEHDDRKSITGTGLGMYITKRYVESMQGRVWFESTHGKGTKFYFSLPLAKQRIKTRLKKLVKHKFARNKK